MASIPRHPRPASPSTARRLARADARRRTWTGAALGLALTGLASLAIPMPLAAAAATAGATADADVVSLDHARAEHEAGRALLIDIREPEEHATGVAAGAVLLPMQQLGRRLAEIPTDPAQPVLLICNTQNRSARTLRALRQRGYGHVRYVQGGMAEWARRGWPMVKPGS